MVTEATESAPRVLTTDDASALGRLAFEAFRGGPDDHGESLDGHVDDMRRTLAGAFGPPMLDAPSASR